MITFKVTSDIKEVTRYLDRVSKKQIPFATSQALNDTAFAIQRAEKAQTHKKLDRPTPYTQKGFRVIKSNKRNLEAVVYIDPSRMSYLQDVVIGGRKLPKKKTIPVPVNVKLNKYGNIPNKRKGLIKNKKQFIGKVKGTLGVWERTNRNRRVKLMIALETSVTHKERFPFHKIADGVTVNTFINNFNRRLTHALSTAR